MHKNDLTRERKLFLVTSEPITPRQHREIADRLVDLSDNALIPLALVFCGVIAVAGYVCVLGNWQGAKDILLIFLPPMTALPGAASAACFRF